MGLVLFQYRLIRASHGIAIDIAGELTIFDELDFGEHKIGRARVGDTVYVDLTPACSIIGSTPSRLERLVPDEFDTQYLIRGVRRITDHLAVGPAYQRSVFTMENIGYAPTDFQQEGLEAAAMGWAAKALGIDAPSPTIQLDSESRRYIFTYPEKGPGSLSEADLRPGHV